MTSLPEHLKAMFTAAERDLIRRELGVQFGQPPNVADGLFLRTWRGGPQAGRPKLPATAQSMVKRGLSEYAWMAACMPERVNDIDAAGFGIQA